MYVWVGRGKGRTYDATWADVSGAGSNGMAVVSIYLLRKLCRLNKSAMMAGLPHSISPINM